MPSVVDIVRSGNCGESSQGDFRSLCIKRGTKQEFISGDSPKLKEIADRALGLTESAALAAGIQAFQLFSAVKTPSIELILKYGLNHRNECVMLYTALSLRQTHSNCHRMICGMVNTNL